MSWRIHRSRLELSISDRNTICRSSGWYTVSWRVRRYNFRSNILDTPSYNPMNVKYLIIPVDDNWRSTERFLVSNMVVTIYERAISCNVVVRCSIRASRNDTQIQAPCILASIYMQIDGPRKSNFRKFYGEKHRASLSLKRGASFNRCNITLLRDNCSFDRY